MPSLLLDLVEITSSVVQIQENQSSKNKTLAGEHTLEQRLIQFLLKICHITMLQAKPYKNFTKSKNIYRTWHN